MNREIIEALHQIEKEKGIAFETLIAALEDALHSAYKKTPDAVDHAKVEIDPETGDMRVFELIFPDHVDVEALKVLNERRRRDRHRPLGHRRERGRAHEVTPDDFGRIAAQTAKQVILQRIREAERDLMYDEYVDRVGDIVTGIVQQSDPRYTLVELGRVEAAAAPSEQIETERYDHGARIKAIIIKVQNSSQGPAGHPLAAQRRARAQALRARGARDRRRPGRDPPRRPRDGLSRPTSRPRPLQDRRRLARRRRRPGRRLRRARAARACAWSSASCAASASTSSRTTRTPARFVAKALSPARVREVIVDDEERTATIIVPDDQLSLAIGKEGQNARLASKLTGWRIDIKSQQQMAEAESEMEFGDDEDVDGQCMAVMRSGKRCPNHGRAGLALLQHPRRLRRAPSEAAAAEAAAEATRRSSPRGEAGEE